MPRIPFRSPRRLLCGLALAACILAPLGRPGHRVDAGTAVRLEVPDLVQHADLIVQGRVVARRSVEDESGRIDTEFTLSVDRTFWGEHRATRVVRLPGGELPDGRGMVLPGMPTMIVGEDVVLFLSRPGPSGMRMPTGLAQGKLRLVVDLNGRRRLVREQAALELLDATTGHLRPAETSTSFEYAAFTAEVEAALAVKRARRAQGR